jgi:hypothetical protein
MVDYRLFCRYNAINTHYSLKVKAISCGMLVLIHVQYCSIWLKPLTGAGGGRGEWEFKFLISDNSFEGGRGRQEGRVERQRNEE